jgi:FAD:protein FMN transferase
MRRAWRSLLIIVALALLAGCGEQFHRQQSYVFGTLVEITVYGEKEDKARQVTNQVLKDFDEMHRTLHAWQPGTLERINGILALARPDAPAKAALSPGLIPILKDATRLSEVGEGLFNPAIGNLVRLWGFHSDTFEPRMPDPREIERLVKANPRMTDLHIDGLMLTGTNPAVRLDLGGYAKGYALDLAAGYLKSQGVKNALINIGGNIMALGSKGGTPWRVGIQHPRRAGALATLDLKDGEAIGTSGDYQRYFEVGGKRYCHLIDPRTGWPADKTQAVTVIAHGPHAGTLSDVASKPLFIGGPTEWPRLAGKMGIREVLFAAADGSITVTRKMSDRLIWEKPPSQAQAPQVSVTE